MQNENFDPQHITLAERKYLNTGFFKAFLNIVGYHGSYFVGVTFHDLKLCRTGIRVLWDSFTLFTVRKLSS